MAATKKKRNYKKEYANYHSKPEQRANRSSRTVASRDIKKCPKGKDVAHKDGNPKNNKKSNLKCQSKSKNRSYARTKTARKKNKRD
jgi:hypothetical protein